MKTSLNPISISTHGHLIVFGHFTRINLKETIWERMIIKYLGLKYDIKAILGFEGYQK